MADGNQIQTTMTMDQAQFMREMAKQVSTIAKSARAFVEMKQAAQQAGQGVKQSLDLSLPTLAQMGQSIVGFGTLAQGVMAAVRGSVQLVIADFDKLSTRSTEAFNATRSPANSLREAALNVRPEELEWLQKSVEQLSADPRINTSIETGAKVLSGIRSAAGNVPLEDIRKTAEVTLRGIGPDRPDAAEQVGIALMDLMSSERRFVPNLTPEASFGALLALQANSHMASAENTAKSFGPLQASLGVYGQRFHETAAPFGALTVFGKDATGQVSAEGFRKTSEELMSFTPENDAKRLERLNTMFSESLNATDFAGNDTKKRQQYRDKLAALDLKDPTQQAAEMVKLLEEIQAKFREGSDARARIRRDIDRIKIAQTHQRSTDIGGMPVDVPIEEVKIFQAAKTPVEKLWTLATKTPALAKSAEANIEFGRGKTREFFVGWMKNDPTITKLIRDTEKETPTLTNDRAVDFERWVTKLNANRLQVMARSHQRLQAATQRVELGSPLEQQFGLAKKSVEDLHKKTDTPYVKQWLQTSLMPIFEQEQSKQDPIGVAVPKLKAELGRLEQELAPRPHLDSVAKPTVFVSGFKGFVEDKPVEGQQREQVVERVKFIKTLIDNLEQTKGDMARPAQKVRGSTDSASKVVKVQPVSGPDPLKVQIVPALKAAQPEDGGGKATGDKATQPQATPPAVPLTRVDQSGTPIEASGNRVVAGMDGVKLISEPIRQRLRPELDASVVDTGDTIARQIYAVPHQATVSLKSSKATEDPQAQMPPVAPKFAALTAMLMGSLPTVSIREATSRDERSSTAIWSEKSEQRYKEAVIERVLSVADERTQWTREKLEQTHRETFQGDTQAFAAHMQTEIVREAEKRRDNAPVSQEVSDAGWERDFTGVGFGQSLIEALPTAEPVMKRRPPGKTHTEIDPTADKLTLAANNIAEMKPEQFERTPYQESLHKALTQAERLSRPGMTPEPMPTERHQSIVRAIEQAGQIMRGEPVQAAEKAADLTPRLFVSEQAKQRHKSAIVDEVLRAGGGENLAGIEETYKQFNGDDAGFREHAANTMLSHAQDIEGPRAERFYLAATRIRGMRPEHFERKLDGATKLQRFEGHRAVDLVGASAIESFDQTGTQSAANHQSQPVSPLSDIKPIVSAKAAQAWANSQAAKLIPVKQSERAEQAWQSVREAKDSKSSFEMTEVDASGKPAKPQRFQMTPVMSERAQVSMQRVAARNPFTDKPVVSERAFAAMEKVPSLRNRAVTESGPSPLSLGTAEGSADDYATATSSDFRQPPAPIVNVNGPDNKGIEALLRRLVELTETQPRNTVAQAPVAERRTVSRERTSTRPGSLLQTR